MKILGVVAVLGVAGCWGAGAGEATSAPPVTVEVAAGGEALQLLEAGREALKAGRWVEAAALYEKARTMEPDNREAAFGLSAAYMELQRFPEAYPLLERLHEDVPDDPMVKNNLAWVCVKAKEPALRDPARAIRLAREAVLDVPADASVWNTLGEAYYAAGQFEKALRAARSALSLGLLAGSPNVAASRELVARCRRAVGASSLEDAGEDHP
jgi:tetratricopeptide (TPR) repeat protein